MSKTYKPYQPEQDLLLPPSLKDWLPEKHLAYFVSEVVDELDLSGIYAVYEKDERGQPPYDPRMMTKVLVYGYCVGVYSARKIQQRLMRTWRSGCWRRAMRRTSGPSRTFGSSTWRC